MNQQAKNNSLPKILIVGDAVAPTGYSRVIQEIFKPIVNQFEIHQFGVNYQGEPHDWLWKIYPAKDDDSPYGFNRLESILKMVKPDLIFMVNDDFVLSRWMKVIRNWKGRAAAKVILYCPVDFYPLLPEFTSEFIHADRIFTYTRFGQDCFKNAAELNTEMQNIHTEILPHGVNTDVFFPLENDIHYHLNDEGRLKAKRKLARGEKTFDNSFIVLNANRNQERKRLDITIKGFAEFAKGKPDSVMLYLHCGVKDLGWNLIDFAKREGIYDRLIMTTIHGVKPAVSNAELNMIYNACDVGINTSSGEGWGLVSFEHAAAGAAQLIPNHTGCRELWNNYAELLNPTVSITEKEHLREHHIISPKTVAIALERLYSDREHLRRMSIAAFENAIRPQYNWQHISDQWKNIFQEELFKIMQEHKTEKESMVTNGLV